MTLRVLDKAAELELHDKLDDLGIGILAAPSVLEAAGKGLQRIPGGRAEAAGTALYGLGEALHSNPYYNLPGYALVAPTITHGLAEKLEGPKTASARQLGADAARILFRI